eukprot:3168902-Amphidinium_carterae.1
MLGVERLRGVSRGEEPHGTARHLARQRVQHKWIRGVVKQLCQRITSVVRENPNRCVKRATTLTSTTKSPELPDFDGDDTQIVDGEENKVKPCMDDPLEKEKKKEDTNGDSN